MATSAPRVALLSAARTPIGKFGGALAKVSAVGLGACAAKEALRRSGLAGKQVDEVLMGSCIQAGLGQNPARQVQLSTDVPYERGAVTINKVCGSGLRAAILACSEIRAGDIDVALVGGMESMSQGPHLLPRVRTGLRYGDGAVVDSVSHDSLEDAYGNGPMGRTADATARHHSVSREEQDRFALRSHQRAQKAQEEGRLREEIVGVPAEVTGGAPLERDEGVRGDATMERLAKLKPVFASDGTVTAGNASQLSDGAAALVLASEAKVKRLGLSPLAWIHSYHTGGVQPARITESPIPTVREHLARRSIPLESLDVVEVNEAFAASCVAFLKELPVAEDRFNPNGGAVALGHPIGATGARLIATLAYELRRRQGERGLASLCMGGGNGLSIVLDSH